MPSKHLPRHKDLKKPPASKIHFGDLPKSSSDESNKDNTKINKSINETVNTHPNSSIDPLLVEEGYTIVQDSRLSKPESYNKQTMISKMSTNSLNSQINSLYLLRREKKYLTQQQNQTLKNLIYHRIQKIINSWRNDYQFDIHSLPDEKDGQQYFVVHCIKRIIKKMRQFHADGKYISPLNPKGYHFKDIIMFTIITGMGNRSKKYNYPPIKDITLQYLSQNGEQNKFSFSQRKQEDGFTVYLRI